MSNQAPIELLAVDEFDKWYDANRFNLGTLDRDQARFFYMSGVRAMAAPSWLKPIDMVLRCPVCAMQHIDEPQPDRGWDNPPHRSHECQGCGNVWRPADIPTNGVVSIKTQGKLDSTR